MRGNPAEPRAIAARRRRADSVLPEVFGRGDQGLALLANSVNEGLVTVDAEGRITWVNRSLCEMTGYTPDEIVGHHPTEFLEPSSRDRFQQHFGHRSLGARERYEIDWIRRDGSRLCSIVSPQPLFARGGEFAGSVAIISDVTELKRTQRALERSERHFRELVDYASSIILRWAVDGTIEFINPYGLRLLGYQRHEIVGRNVLETIVPAADSTGRDLREMIRDIPAHPERYLYNENEITDSSGRRFWVVWTNRALMDANGKVTEILSIGTDITELKSARESLAKQRDELTELNDFIRRAFGRYVSDAVVRSLLESPGGLRVGGSNRTVSILVADIRGFSSLCEELSPAQVVTLLNTFFEEMTGVVEEHGGTIDELIGDGVLVIFGAPVAAADHARRAVECAVAMQRAIPDVNARNRERGLPAIEMGVGIDTGEVIVGNIGSVKRAKYGVVGNHVNLASRIESYTVGGQILVSDDTRRAAGPALRIGRRLDVEPKGARQRMPVFEVLGIGSHNLPGRASSSLSYDVDLPVRFVRVEEKFVQDAQCRGRVVRLSTTEAELRCDSAPPLLADLRLSFTIDDASAPAENIYAKVIDRRDDGWVRLRFTAVLPPARRLIARLLARANPPSRWEISTPAR